MNTAERILVDCLHEDAARLEPAALLRLTDHDWDTVLALARRHRVRPLVQRRLEQPDLRAAVPGRVRTQLKTECFAIASRNLQMHADLVDLTRRLGAEGIPVLWLKGMHLATAVYGNLALREIGDLDVMVRREHLERAVTIALASGYAAATSFDVRDDTAVSQHVTGLFKARTLLEIHWNLVPPGSPYSIDPSALWERAEPAEMFGSRGLVLSTGDLLLHICLHAAFLHRFEIGLRPHCDLAALLRARTDRLHWDDVGRQAAAWNWSRSVSLSLRVTRDLLGVPLASAAFPIDGLSMDVVAAARDQLFAGSDRATVPTGELSGLLDGSVAGRIGHIWRVLFAPAPVLRRLYPSFPRSRLVWWTVYLVRAGDLARRHAGWLWRIVVAGDRSARAAVDRQGRLTRFLVGEC